MEQEPEMGINYYLRRKSKKLKNGEIKEYVYLFKSICINGKCKQINIGNVEEIDKIITEYKKKNTRPYWKRRRSPASVCVAGPGGFEPPTTGLGGQRSVLAELRALSIGARCCFLLIGFCCAGFKGYF